MMSNTKPDVAENLKRLGCLIAILCFAAVVAGFFAPLHSPRHRAEELLQKGAAAFEAKDYEIAVKYFTSAAKQGNAEAQFMLGYCYKAGIGVEANGAEAEKWFHKAAEQGDQSAAKLLEVPKLLKAIEDNDENTIREIQETWLKDAARKATEENDRMSQLGLAVSQENKGNMSEAIKWYRKAAENGDHLAQYRLGNFYDKGEGGVQQDKAEAVKWFRMGAEQNVINCQYVLGLHYENGDGVDKDMDEAVKWYRKAAENGQRDAIDALKRLGAE